MITASVVPTVCPRSSDPFYIVIYYIKWVTTTSWTYSIQTKNKMPGQADSLYKCKYWIR